MMVVSENGEMIVSENAEKVKILVMIVYENAGMVDYDDELLVESHIENFQYVQDYFVKVTYSVVA